MISRFIFFFPLAVRRIAHTSSGADIKISLSYTVSSSSKCV